MRVLLALLTVGHVFCLVRSAADDLPDRYYILEAVLRHINTLLAGGASRQGHAAEARPGNPFYLNRSPSEVQESNDDVAFGYQLDGPEPKRAPPLYGFSAIRGKRGESRLLDFRSPITDDEMRQRFFDGIQYLNQRAKKSDTYNERKRYPNPDDFFQIRGKKNTNDVLKRFPSDGDFFMARGKKSDYPIESQLMGFFGARGRKRGSKRVPGPHDFFGARGKREPEAELDDVLQDKRDFARGFFGSRGKRAIDSELGSMTKNGDKRTISATKTTGPDSLVG